MFVETTTETTPSWLSIPYGAIARARPSQTALLNYLVIWDGDGHADSFVVDARHVKSLHQYIGRALLGRVPGGDAKGRHAITGSD